MAGRRDFQRQAARVGVPVRRRPARLRRGFGGPRRGAGAPRGPTATAPVTMGDEGAEKRDGVEAKAVIVEQLARALEVIREHDPARIATLGGECAVSVAPFSALAHRYGDDLAIVWIDSHPDVGTPASEYPASRTSPRGAFRRSARTMCARRPGRSWTGWPAPAARASRSTSTSTRSTPPSSCSGSAPSRAVSQRAGTTHRRRRRRRHGRRRAHDRRVLPPVGHAPAADPGRLPADLRAGLYCLAVARWMKSSGSMRWSWLSSPPSSSIHLIVPVNVLSPAG